MKEKAAIKKYAKKYGGKVRFHRNGTLTLKCSRSRRSVASDQYVNGVHNTVRRIKSFIEYCGYTTCYPASPKVKFVSKTRRIKKVFYKYKFKK